MAENSLEMKILFVFINIQQVIKVLKLLPRELYGISVSENTEREGKSLLFRVKIHFSVVYIGWTVLKLVLQIGI